jgi:hypothetical protein
MKKLMNIDYDDYIKYINTIDNLRNDVSKKQQEINNLNKDIKFLKDSGENIFVIVKQQNKPDVHEYKTNEKNILTDLVQENYRVRERYDELSRKIDNIENQKSMIILKYREMDNIYKSKITKIEKYVKYLENRKFWNRLKNVKKHVDISEYVSYDDSELLENGSTKTIYSVDEIKKLEEQAKKVKKPRGWHFKKEFIDEKGNVYYKGKLQPHLKKNDII